MSRTDVERLLCRGLPVIRRKERSLVAPYLELMRGAGRGGEYQDCWYGGSPFVNFMDAELLDNGRFHWTREEAIAFLCAGGRPMLTETTFLACSFPGSGNGACGW